MPAQRLGVFRDQQGIALAAVLAIVLVMLPLAAFVSLQAVVDLRVQHNLRAATEAFYVAEAGLEHALADLRPTVSLEPLLYGPDLTPATADDGIYPFRDGSPPAFPRQPWGYRVEVADAGDGTIFLRSRGEGPGNALKIVEARVLLSAEPFTPAALYTNGTLADVAAGTRISGFDGAAGVPVEAAGGDDLSLPAIAVPGEAEAAGLRARLAEAGEGQIAGYGGTPSVAAVLPLDVAALARTVRGDPRATRRPAPVTPLDWAVGTAAQPRATVVVGDLETRGRVEGHGVLVVDGSWRVDGVVSWSGLVIVLGDLSFAPASHVSVYGALWHADGSGRSLSLLGDNRILLDRSALRGAGDALPGLLPRLPRTVAWREIL